MFYECRYKFCSSVFHASMREGEKCALEGQYGIHGFPNATELASMASL